MYMKMIDLNTKKQSWGDHKHKRVNQ